MSASSPFADDAATDPEDRELVLRAQAGDRDALTNALRVYSAYIGGDALVVGCDVAEARIEWHPGVETRVILKRDGATVWHASHESRA